MTAVAGVLFSVIRGRGGQMKKVLRNTGMVVLSVILFFNVTIYVLQMDKVIGPVFEKVTEWVMPEGAEEKITEEKEKTVFLKPSDSAKLTLKRFSMEGKDLYEISTGRTAIWKEYFKKLNLFGHGDSGAGVIRHGEDEWEYRTAHMTFLQIAYESGIVAELFFLMFHLCAGILSVLFALRRKDEPYALFPLLITVAYAVQCRLESTAVSFWYMSTFLYCLVQFPLMMKGNLAEKKTCMGNDKD